MRIAFLDEFGHIGPYISRTDRKYRQSPVFGLAGFIIPHEKTRAFATWFFQFKNNLLAADLERSIKHPATWEKKGSELITTRNINNYASIREAMSRLLNKIYKCNGKIFYYGRQKYQSPADSNPSGLYTTCLSHSIRQLDNYSGHYNSEFMMILDQHAERLKLLETAAKTMFGERPARHLVEPPFQVDSHLYQTVQAADWVATLVGRLMAYRTNPHEFTDWEWTEKFFGKTIDAYSTHSKLWRPEVPKAE